LADLYAAFIYLQFKKNVSVLATVGHPGSYCSLSWSVFGCFKVFFSMLLIMLAKNIIFAQ